MTAAVVAREAVEKFGDLKRAESVVGTGPWMLDSYRPNAGLTFLRHPQYFQAGLPYIDRVEMAVDEDNASRMSAFLAGKYDLGWDLPGAIGRTDWVQIKDTLKQRRPGLRTAEFVSNVETHVSMRTDQKPFSDSRVRQALSLAIDRQGVLDATAEGVGIFNPAIPAAFKEWSLPIDQLGGCHQDVRWRPGAPRRRRLSERLSASLVSPPTAPRCSSTRSPSGTQGHRHRDEAHRRASASSRPAFCKLKLLTYGPGPLRRPRTTSTAHYGRAEDQANEMIRS
jgi:ABC-type transport system substrate-binding protein